jgi:hypothetical protein
LAFITASMVVLREKLGDRHADQSADVLEIVSRALFLGSSRVHLTLLMASKRLPRTWTALRKRTCDIHVMCIRFFLAGCTSIQIAASLRYE